MYGRERKVKILFFYLPFTFILHSIIFFLLWFLSVGLSVALVVLRGGRKTK